MVDDQASADVQALHRAPELDRPFASDLTRLSAEKAATDLVDRFAKTGYAQADVADPVAVKEDHPPRLSQTSAPVRTYGVSAVVVAVDEDRNAAWLASPEGAEYQSAQGDAALAAFAEVRWRHRY